MPSMGNPGMILVGYGALLISAAVAHGEEPPALQLGSRVRVTIMEGSQGSDSNHGTRLTGRLLGLSDTALTVETSPGRPSIVVSRPSVASVERSVRRSQRKKGALIGLAVGAGAGLVIAAVDSGGSCPPPEEDFLGLCRGLQEELAGPAYAAGALLFGAAGAGIGALVAHGEKWETVPSDRLRVAFGPAHGGVRFGVSLLF